MSLLDFGTPGKVVAAADTTGQNAGNLTIVFKPTILGVWLSEFVIYHMVLENLTLGAQAKIILNAEHVRLLRPGYRCRAGVVRHALHEIRRRAGLPVQPGQLGTRNRR